MICIRLLAKSVRTLIMVIFSSRRDEGCGLIKVYLTKGIDSAQG